MHNKPMLQIVQQPRLEIRPEIRPLITPCLRRARARSDRPEAAAAPPPWRERRYRPGG